MKLHLTLVALLFSSFTFAQFDTIVLINGTHHAVIIKEINEKTVKYKNPADSLGPTLVVQKKLIERFILKGGCVDLKEVGYENCVKDPSYDILPNSKFKRFLISTDLAQLIVIQHFQFNLEYVLRNRKAGFEVFINDGLFDESSIKTYNRIEVKLNPVQNGNGYYKYSYGGFNLKFYPYAHKKTTYFLAFGIEKGKASARLRFEETSIKGQFSTTSIYYKRFEASYNNFHINNGIVFRPSKNLVFQTYVGIGINQFEKYNVEKNAKKTYSYSPKIGLGLTAGFAL